VREDFAAQYWLRGLDTMSESDAEGRRSWAQVIVGDVAIIGFILLVCMVPFMSMGGPRLCTVKNWLSIEDRSLPVYVSWCCFVYGGWKAGVDAFWRLNETLLSWPNPLEQLVWLTMYPWRNPGGAWNVTKAIFSCPIDLFTGTVGFTCEDFDWSCLAVLVPYERVLYC
jgi:hypothetical protein